MGNFTRKCRKISDLELRSALTTANARLALCEEREGTSGMDKESHGNREC